MQTETITNPTLKKTLVTQGEFATSADPNEVLTTILGSCICTCMYDPVAKVGGINHFLLGDTPKDQSQSTKYGVHSMELLINGLLKRGARRERLLAKLAGGAKMLNGISDIGAANAAFATQFLEREDIVVIGTNLGGDMARRIRFWPATGRTQVLMVQNTETAKIEASLARKIAAKPRDMGDVELF
ncbi:MAG: chemotaxis protein CheD [Alphaproteobacteria bacterium]|nr:chemotaxis protein CheD [Alphaproteobacteria bacterium]